jgi:hypothetical protein
MRYAVENNTKLIIDFDLVSEGGDGPLVPQVFLLLVDRLPDQELRDAVRRHHEQFGADILLPIESPVISTRYDSFR